MPFNTVRASLLALIYLWALAKALLTVSVSAIDSLLTVFSPKVQPFKVKLPTAVLLIEVSLPSVWVIEVITSAEVSVERVASKLLIAAFLSAISWLTALMRASVSTLIAHRRMSFFCA